MAIVKPDPPLQASACPVSVSDTVAYIIFHPCRTLTYITPLLKQIIKILFLYNISSWWLCESIVTREKEKEIL